MIRATFQLALSVLLGITSAASFAVAPPVSGVRNTIAELAVARRNAARAAYESMWASSRERQVSMDGVYRWSVRWLEAERQLSDTPAGQVAACKDHYLRMIKLEAYVRKLMRAGHATLDEMDAVIYYQVEAALWWMQAKEYSGEP